MSEIRSPIKVVKSNKMMELLNWDKIEELNAKVDEGVSSKVISAWANRVKFKISPTVLTRYREARAQAILNGIHVSKIIMPVSGQRAKWNPTATILRTPVMNLENQRKALAESRVTLVKSELDVLDKIIQLGYENIEENYERIGEAGVRHHIRPELAMQAIKLKNEITGGSFGGLTNHGLESLRELENTKYQMLLGIMLKYIPEDLRDAVLQEMETAEEGYYRNTDYYEQYMTLRESTLDVQAIESDVMDNG